jgi:hypothetical protein
VAASPHHQVEAQVVLSSAIAMPPDLSAPSDLAGPPPCTTLPRAVLLCEDFEAATLDSNTWSSDGNEKLDGVHTHRGAQALHATMPALGTSGMSGAQIVERKTFAMSSSTELYIRVWAFFPLPPLAGNHARVFAVQQDGAQYEGMGVFVAPTFLHLDDWISGATQDSTTAPTYGAWACYRGHITLDTLVGSFSVDGTNTPTVALQSTPTQMPTGFQPVGEITIGLYMQNPAKVQPPIEAWIDDVIIDNQPVDCTD